MRETWAVPIARAAIEKISRLVATIAIGAAVLAGPATNARADGGVGLALGPIISVLERPDDAVGEPTFMNGTAFSGVGFSVGVNVELKIWEVIHADLGVFLSFKHGEGWQRNETQSRELILSTMDLRLPLLIKGVFELFEGFRVAVGLGPEFVLGVGSSLEITETNVLPEEQLNIKPAKQNGIFLATMVSVDYALGPVRIPLTLRFAYNPAVGSTTPERFSGWQSPENPGAFRTEFNWDLQLHLGAMWAW